MHTIICKRSGLTFGSESLRRKVHPQISPWTAHKDPEIRQKAVEVIERGKGEGWATLEEFERAINAALNAPPPQPEGYKLKLRQASRIGGYRKPWVAIITGTSEVYGYARKFVEPFSTQKGGTWVFGLKDGVYEVCDRNSKGAEQRYWLKVEGTAGEVLTQAEAEAIAGPPADAKGKGRSSGELPLARPDEEAVEECWECGARYTQYGYVEEGNMSCRRCS